MKEEGGIMGKYRTVKMIHATGLVEIMLSLAPGRNKYIRALAVLFLNHIGGNLSCAWM